VEGWRNERSRDLGIAFSYGRKKFASRGIAAFEILARRGICPLSASISIRLNEPPGECVTRHRNHLSLSPIAAPFSDPRGAAAPSVYCASILIAAIFCWI
jgi:hypothetical protein